MHNVILKSLMFFIAEAVEATELSFESMLQFFVSFHLKILTPGKFQFRQSSQKGDMRVSLVV